MPNPYQRSGGVIRDRKGCFPLALDFLQVALKLFFKILAVSSLVLLAGIVILRMGILGPLGTEEMFLVLGAVAVITLVVWIAKAARSK